MHSESSKSSLPIPSHHVGNQDDTEAEEDLEEEAPVTKKRRGQSKIYDPVLGFRSCKAAEEALKEEFEGGLWHYKYKHGVGDETKRYYVCKKGCTKKLFMLLHSEHSGVTIYLSDCDHSHTNTHNDFYLPTETVELVKELVLNRHILVPKLILREIIRQNKPQITTKQLTNLKARLMVKAFGRATVILNDLLDWCDTRCDVPIDLDEIFVAGYRYELNTKTELITLNIVVVTKRLLLNARNSPLLAADGTHKLIWQSFPVLICGNVDKGRHFHPLGLMVSKTELHSDYEFFFASIRDRLKELFDYDYSPRILLADSAGAITNGFKEAFPNCLVTRINCWAHVIRNIDIHLKPINKTDFDLIRNDICALQISSSKEIFDKCIELFIIKWRLKNDSKINEFLEHFKHEYCSELNFGWFEGHSESDPSQNNALEGTNRVVKDEGTLRKRYPVHQFLNLLQFGFVHQWSKDRDPLNINCKHWLHEPVIDLKIETDAFQWQSLNKKVKKFTHDNILYNCTPDGESVDLSSDECGQYFSDMLQLNFQTFDDLIKRRDSVNVIRINTSNWKLSSCICRTYGKEYMCSHIIAISNRLGLFTFSDAAKLIPVGQNRSRGRPAKTAPALVLQPGESERPAKMSKTSRSLPTQIASNQIASNQVASNQIVSTQIASTQIASNQIVSTQIASTQIVSNHIASTQIGHNLISTTQIEPNRIAFTQIDPNRIEQNLIEPNQSAKPKGKRGRKSNAEKAAAKARASLLLP